MNPTEETHAPAAPVKAKRPTRTDPEFHKRSPCWQEAQRKKAETAAIHAAALKAVEAGIVTLPDGVQILPGPAPGAEGAVAQDSQVSLITPVLTKQIDSLRTLAEGGADAAKYLVQVARGRKKGDQWRMRACSEILDRIDATGATVERARAAGANAAIGAADLGALLSKLAEARALQARKAGAIDAETGQTSGKAPALSVVPPL